MKGKRKPWTLREFTSLVVSIITLITGVIFSSVQLRLAYIAGERERRQEPLSYILEPVESHYEYEISFDGKHLNCPAPSSLLTVQTGALLSATAIAFDGNSYGAIAPLTMLRDWDDCKVEITLPVADEPLVAGNVIYDYYFLFLEPMAGSPVLDLVCNEIDLQNGQITPKVYHHTALLEQGEGSDTPKQVMLSNYANLYEALENLPGRTAT